VRRETGVSWLDAAVNNANVPQTVDTETAIEIHLRITGEEPAVETYRRFEVAYRLIGRERRYTVDDVVAFAKKRFEQAPVRRSGASIPRRRPGAATPAAFGARSTGAADAASASLSQEILRETRRPRRHR
jgi:hypothetical protein